MARFLVYTSPARGHLYPVVGTLIELRRRGHEVAVRTLASEVPRMQELGFAAAAIAPAIEALPHDDWRARTPVGANKRAMKTYAQRAEYEIPDLEAAVATTEPDVLLIDVMAQGAVISADAGMRPWAMWTPFFTPLPSRDAPPFGLGLHPRPGLIGRLRDALIAKVAIAPVFRESARHMNPLRTRFGLPQLQHPTDQWIAAPLHLYFTAPPFEYPRSDWPDAFRLVGPGTWHPPADPPAWLDDLERPLVLVTLSTEFQDDGELAATALQALAAEDVEVVVTTAAVDPSSFDPPRNARVEQFLPHGPLLQRAACVVCHGGMGITQRALTEGVPVCVVPYGRDQLEVAGHLTWCDAGTRLSPRRLRPDRLRAAVREAIAKRPGAQAVAEAFAAAGGAAAGADALEELVPATSVVPTSI